MADKAFLWLFTFIFVIIDKSTCDSVKAANEYVDSVLSTKLRKVDKISAVKLPDFTTENRDRFLFITSRVRTSYSKGSLHNLENVARLGDCLPHTTSAVHSMECTLQFKHLRAEYQASMRYGRLPKISISAKAIVKPIEAKIQVEKRVPNNTPELTKFQMITPVDIDVSFKGLGLLNRYLKMLKSDFEKYVGDYIQEAVNYDFRNTLSRSLSSVELKL